MPEIQSIEYSQDYFIEIEKKLRKKLSEKRFRHTLGVANTAANMAMVHGEDVSRAYLAGLLHDNAKCIESDKKIRLCEKYGLSISKTERENPELLHAKLGSYLAKKNYQVEDEEILSAIACHTTGKPEMTVLEKILFVADYIEPTRKLIPNLQVVREAAFSDLDKAVLLELHGTLNYIKNKAAATDDITLETYHYYKTKDAGQVLEAI